MRGKNFQIKWETATVSEVRPSLCTEAEVLFSFKKG
jgi:hypothetical protein